MAVDKTPTLDELFKRFRSNESVIFRAIAKSMYATVAAGVRDPIKKPLPPNMTILACQAMVILLDHIEKMEQQDGTKSNMESSN